MVCCCRCCWCDRDVFCVCVCVTGVFQCARPCVCQCVLHLRCSSLKVARPDIGVPWTCKTWVWLLLGDVCVCGHRNVLYCPCGPPCVGLQEQPPARLQPFLYAHAHDWHLLHGAA